MNKRSMNHFLIAFKQETGVGPIYTMHQWIKARDRDEAILKYKIKSHIPLGILGSYVVVREGLTKKEDLSPYSIKHERKIHMNTTFEKVIMCFNKHESHDINIFDPRKFLTVYDKENDYRKATITDIARDSDEEIVIQIRYDDDDTTRWYLISDEVDVEIPRTVTHVDCFYEGSSSFDYLFMTEDQMMKYRDKVWPKMFGTSDDICLEFNKTIDPTHADYDLIWWDGFNRRNEYTITLSREDINSLINDKETFINQLTDSICILGLWTPPTKEDKDNE